MSTCHDQTSPITPFPGFWFGSWSAWRTSASHRSPLTSPAVFRASPPSTPMGEGPTSCTGRRWAVWSRGALPPRDPVHHSSSTDCQIYIWLIFFLFFSIDSIKLNLVLDCQRSLAGLIVNQWRMVSRHMNPRALLARHSIRQANSQGRNYLHPHV